MAAHLGFTGEALLMSLLSHDLLQWLDVCNFEQGILKAVFIQFIVLTFRIRSVGVWFYLLQAPTGL